jgi:hypothetical protein
MIIPGFTIFPTPTHDIPNSEATKLANSVVRLGAGSDFGFHKPSRFFGVPAPRLESPTIRFGMGSVSAVRQKGHRKRRYDSSTLCCNGKERVPHNPLVTGSSPGESTIFHRNLGVMSSGDHSPLVSPMAGNSGGVRLGCEEAQGSDRFDSTDCTA